MTTSTSILTALRPTCEHIGAPVVLGIAGLVCARCDAPVVLATPQTEPDTYGSRAPYAPPPGRSHRWMRDHGPELVPHGAVRTGGRRGRSVLWTVSRAGWLAYVEATRRTEPAPASTTTVAPVIDATAWIRQAGHRITREVG